MHNGSVTVRKTRARDAPSESAMPTTTPVSTPAESTPTMAATAIQKSNRVTRRSRRSSGRSIIPKTTASMITAASSSACSAISPARVAAYPGSTGPAGGAGANSWRATTPSHIACMPPSGSHTDMAMNVSPW